MHCAALPQSSMGLRVPRNVDHQRCIWRLHRHLGRYINGHLYQPSYQQQNRHFLQLGRLCPVHCCWSLCNSVLRGILEVRHSRHWTGQRSNGNHQWSCIPHWRTSRLPWRIISPLFSLSHSLSKIHSGIWISCAGYSNLYIFYLMFLLYVTKV